jgi:hypothetical protein
MEFRQVVQVQEPSQELYVSSDGSFPVEVNVYDDCDAYFVREAGELEASEQETGKNVWEQFCWKGCDYKAMSHEFWAMSFGRKDVEIVTDCHTGKRYKAAAIPQDELPRINEFVDFVKEFTIESSQFTVRFFGEKSGGDFPVVDFVPDEFEIFNVSDGGRIYDEDGYYAIEWLNVSESFDFSYSMRRKSKLDSCAVGLRDESGNHYGWEVGGAIEVTDSNFWFECNFSSDIDVWVVESVDFERKMDSKIRNDKVSKVSLVGEVSESVDVEFREYVPVEFEVSEISDGGELAISSLSYNVIVWSVNASQFEVSYDVMPSVAGDFSFMSELGGERMDEFNMSVYNFVPSIGPSKGSGGSGGGGGYSYKPYNFSAVDGTHPLVDKFGNLTAGLFSEKFEGKGAFEIFGIRPKSWNRSLKFFDAFGFETNLGENAGGMSFEYRANEKDLKFYGTDKNGKRNMITGMAVAQEGDEFVYRFSGDEFFRNISVWSEISLNWWQRFLGKVCKFLKLRLRAV